jgi:serine/threonine protein kinase
MCAMQNEGDHTKAFLVITPGISISQYKIVRQLGAGGMGEVYLAEDSKLGRQAALKFLPPQMASDDSLKARFQREARAAAVLNHPNIITIYEIGEFQSRPYIAMEYVKGQPLRDVIEAGGVSLDQAIKIGRQVCEGLSRAHKAGIVHRDIKADNIIIEEGERAKILDFGLAKLAEDDGLTQTGTAMGTVNYMSPEQAQGRDADHRSDIFSAGVLLYQMVTGKLPFQRPNIPATIYAIVHEPHKSVAGLVPDLPEALPRIIDKALVKDLDQRYQDIADLANDLAALQPGAQTTQLSVSAVAAPATRPKSLAVLYLRNLGSPDDEYLSYGITEDLIVDLTRIGNLRVASMRSILKYKESDDELEQIAEKLNVGTVLDGSLHKSNNRVRVSAQLYDAATGDSLWADRWEEDFSDLPQIKRGLAGGIADALELDSGAAGMSRLGEPEAKDPRAYEFYLRGKYAFERKQDAADVDVARGLYDRALELEPGMLAARAGLAEVLMYSGSMGDADKVLREAIEDARQTQMRSEEAMLLRLLAQLQLQQSAWNEAYESAELAQKLSAQSSSMVCEVEALSIMIDVQQRRANFDAALKLFERVVEVNRSLDNQQKVAQALKNMGTAHLRKGEYLKARDLYTEAAKLARRRKDRSLEADCLGNVGLTHFHIGDADKALGSYEEALEIHSQLGDQAKRALWQNNIAQIHESKGSYREALAYFQEAAQIYQELRNDAKLAHAQSNAAAMMTILGDYTGAIGFLHQAIATAQRIDYPLIATSAYDTLASAHFYLNETERAHDYYHLAIETAEQARLPLNAAHSHCNLGELHFFGDEPELAQHDLEVAKALAESISLREVHLKAEGYLAALQVNSGDAGSGMAALRRLSGEVEALNDPRTVLAVKRLLGGVLLKHGADESAHDEGKQLLLDALELARQKEIVYEISWIEKVIGEKQE